MSDNLPIMLYNRFVANAKPQEQTFNRSQYDEQYEDAQFEQEPPVETVINANTIRDHVMDYLGAVLARCWYDKELLSRLEINPHRTLRSIGILLPDELDILFEKKDQQRPKIIIYEWNRERTFKRKICYLQMLMMAGK